MWKLNHFPLSVEYEGVQRKCLSSARGTTTRREGSGCCEDNVCCRTLLATKMGIAVSLSLAESTHTMLPPCTIPSKPLQETLPCMPSGCIPSILNSVGQYPTTYLDYVFLWEFFTASSKDVSSKYYSWVKLIYPLLIRRRKMFDAFFSVIAQSWTISCLLFYGARGSVKVFIIIANEHVPFSFSSSILIHTVHNNTEYTQMKILREINQ